MASYFEYAASLPKAKRGYKERRMPVHGPQTEAATELWAASDEAFPKYGDNLGPMWWVRRETFEPQPIPVHREAAESGPCCPQRGLSGSEQKCPLCGGAWKPACVEWAEEHEFKALLEAQGK